MPLHEDLKEKIEDILQELKVKVLALRELRHNWGQAKSSHDSILAEHYRESIAKQNDREVQTIIDFIKKI